MKIQSDYNSAELRKLFARRIARQYFSIFTFDIAAFPSSSLYAAASELLDLILGIIADYAGTSRSPFTLLIGMNPIPWWSGQYCIGIYHGSNNNYPERSVEGKLLDAFYAHPARVEAESVMIEDEEDTLVLGCYDPSTTTFYVNSTLAAMLTPDHIAPA